VVVISLAIFAAIRRAAFSGPGKNGNDKTVCRASSSTNIIRAGSL
jgi:hypothetical protein